MDELLKLYAKLRPVIAKGARPEDIDAYVAKHSRGLVKSYAQLEQHLRAQQTQMTTGRETGAFPSPVRAPEGSTNMPAATAAMVGAADAATLGFGPKIEGLVTGAIPGGLDYAGGVRRGRERLQTAHEQHPAAAFAGEMAGGFALPGGFAAKGVREGASAAAAAGRAGLVYGAGSSIGHTDNGDLGDYAKAAGIGGAAGGLAGLTFGWAFEKVLKAGINMFDKAGKLTREAKDALQTLIRRNGGKVEDVEKAYAEAYALNDKALLVDLVPGGARALHAAGDVAPSVGLKAEAVLGERQAGQQGRVESALGEALGVQPHPGLPAGPKGPAVGPRPGIPLTQEASREARLAARDVMAPPGGGDAAGRGLGKRVYGDLDNTLVTDPEVAALLRDREVADHIPRGRIAGHEQPGATLAPEKEIIDAAISNKGGASIDPRTGRVNDAPPGGFVAVVSDRDPIRTAGMSEADINAEIARRVSYLRQKYASELQHPNSPLYIGIDAAEDGSTIGVEVARRYSSIADAEALGIKSKQYSVYNSGTGQSILTGGSRKDALDSTPIWFQNLQGTLQGLRSTAGRLFAKQSMEESRAAAEQARKLTAAMEEAVPGFRKGNAEYGRGARLAGTVSDERTLGSSASAFDYGANFLWDGTSAADARAHVGSVLADLGEDGLNAIRMGAMEAASIRLNQPITSRDIGKAFERMGPELREKMGLLFADEAAAGRFADKMMLEGKMSYSLRHGIGGSRTNLAQNDTRALVEAGVRGNLAGNVLSPVGTVGRATLGILDRKASQQAAEQMGNVLLSGGPEAMSLLSGFDPMFRSRLAAGVASGGVTGGLLSEAQRRRNDAR